EPAQDLLKTAAKVVVLVVVPAVLFRTRLQIRWSRSDTAVTLVLGAVLIGFQIVLGSGLRRLATVRLSTAEIVITTVGALVWMAISAGLVEEYFFRAALQTRMERASGSTLGGIVIAALLFGLIHAPGLYLRSGLTNENVGSHPSLLLAVGYSIVIVSPAGLFFGVLWSRTRNILLLVVLHGVGDLIPNLANFARNFHV
ncbi:MAG TPA: CPBP family intramembrane glutamic endopeptidase, partial [Thermoanaerobaculia bacterium]|nr:CPBP family intramembrane glutamic endopeptidase [Thermoanaerobaculia bacterium]